MKYVERVREGLAGILAGEPRALLLGEDIADPYGGAFKVTRSLSTRFPEQVMQTPISEAGVAGVAAGLVLTGFTPIVEIMFGDFLTLTADAVINTGAKLGWLSGNRLEAGLLIRTPVGGRRGYGPIHSQSLERLFFGWPDVSVYAASLADDPAAVLTGAFRDPATVKLLLETKTDYPRDLWQEGALASEGFTVRRYGPAGAPTVVLSTALEPAGPDLVICCYGGMAAHAVDAARLLLIEDELTCAVVIPHRICPVDVEPIAALVRSAGNLITVEEGYAPAGWGSYLLGALAAAGVPLPLDRVRSVGPRFAPIPAAPQLERDHLPGAPEVARAGRSLR